MFNSSRNRRITDRADPTRRPGGLRSRPSQERGHHPSARRDPQSRDHNPSRAPQRRPLGPPHTETRP